MDFDPQKRKLGLETMAKVYGWPEPTEVHGDFLAYTVDNLFADIWNREGLSYRDRRILLLGVLVGRGLHDVADLQMETALGNAELTPDELREIAIFLCYYAGWPSGAKLHSAAEEVIARVARRTAEAERPAEGS
ncbi:MAG: carboxymuconolactone decarboxylase family protein [Acidimicrobiales bacterium]|jgi:4-carboxymuconolactone decarboxylase|nr:carboxymuconolactone decarboxylase family protein [Acidimicrobiales bacterium]